MKGLYYIGLDIHKKIIAFCIKRVDGVLVNEGKVEATREALKEWVKKIRNPWIGAMEATLFTGWIYDYLKPHAQELKVAHPAMLKAITVGKKKSDQSDAQKIADLLRIGMIPESYMASSEIRELCRVLRYRNHMVRTAVKMKNKIAGLLMETGIPYSKRRLHGKKYFQEVLERVEDISPSVCELLEMSRGGMEMFQAVQKKLIAALRQNEQIKERVERLMTIPSIGEITALTWVLEVGDPDRLVSIRKAVSYCGLCSAYRESAGKEQRGPISKKRNKHLQTMLIEAAKIAPSKNPDLAAIYAKELKRGNRNRATLAVARKMVAYLLAVDKRKMDFAMLDQTQVA